MRLALNRTVEDAVDGFQEFRHVDGFGDVVLETFLQSFLDLQLRGQAGKSHYRNVGGFFKCLHLLQGIQSTAVGKVDIHQHQVRLVFFSLLNSLCHRFGADDLDTRAAGQDIPDQLLNFGAVFDVKQGIFGLFG